LTSAGYPAPGRRWAGGRIVFIKRVTVRNVARYLSKYLTKELLLSAPKGTRRITTARAIKLFPKFQSDIAWALIKSSIYQALEGGARFDGRFNAPNRAFQLYFSAI
jgi:hypothetical protein